MPQPAAAWFHDLTASVFALGTAAREYQAANQTARNAAWHAEPMRLALVDGTLNVPGAFDFRPHDDAVCRLAEAYAELDNCTRELYENTALAYAYGTAAVLRGLSIGERPHQIELDRHEGRYVWPDALLPDLREVLGDWTGNRRLAELRQKVLTRECAHDIVNDLSEGEALTDCEVGEFCRASEFSSGLADAAFAYGEQAESALHWLLLAGKRRL